MKFSARAGFGGWEKVGGAEADQAKEGQDDHGDPIGPAGVGQVRDQDGARDRRAERRPQVGDAPGQPGDFSLGILREGGLHDIDRRGEHDAHPGRGQQSLEDQFPSQ